MAYKVAFPPDVVGEEGNPVGGSLVEKKVVTPVTGGYSGDTKEESLSKDISEGRIIACLIYSHILEAEIWLAVDNDFDPGDGLAVFYAHEIPSLHGKTKDELKQIFRTKLQYGAGTKVEQ